jgi:hypothetical protein
VEPHDRAVRKALEFGQLKRPQGCECCGRPALRDRPLHAHHPDYTKPLRIYWLCGRCHSRWHRNHKARKLRAEQEVVYTVASAGDVKRWRALARKSRRSLENWILHRLSEAK